MAEQTGSQGRLLSSRLDSTVVSRRTARQLAGHSYRAAKCVASFANLLSYSYHEQLGEIYFNFYRAMLCIRGTSHGPVSVSVCVCHKSEFY